MCVTPTPVPESVNKKISPTAAPCTLKSNVKKSLAFVICSQVLLILFHVMLLKLSLVKVTNAPDLTPGWSGKLLEDSPGTNPANVLFKLGAYLAKYAA